MRMLCKPLRLEVIAWHLSRGIFLVLDQKRISWCLFRIDITNLLSFDDDDDDDDVDDDVDENFEFSIV